MFISTSTEFKSDINQIRAKNEVMLTRCIRLTDQR